MLRLRLLAFVEERVLLEDVFLVDLRQVSVAPVPPLKHDLSRGHSLLLSRFYSRIATRTDPDRTRESMHHVVRTRRNGDVTVGVGGECLVLSVGHGF